MPEPNEIEMACEIFSKESGVEMTKAAKQLVALLLNSVETDPHPRWRGKGTGGESAGQFANEAKQITAQLPQILITAYRDASFVDPELEARKVLTIFDLAHHLPRSLVIAARLGGISRI